jgi:hypothetical protein
MYSLKMLHAFLHVSNLSFGDCIEFCARLKGYLLIYENFWAGGVKQPLNPSRHPSMDEASSEAGRTVAMDSS